MFYEQLKQLCDNNKISVTYFVENILMMSRGNVTRWKNGGTPTIELLQKIADYFEVTTDYLLGKTSEFDDFQFALFGEVKDFTDEQKEDILNFARFIKEKEKKADENK